MRPAWVTASEKNSEAFEVERRLSSISFERLGTVAAGSNSARSYGFVDAKLPAGSTALETGGRGQHVQLLGGARDGAATLLGAAPSTAVKVSDTLSRPVASATTDAANMTKQARALPRGGFRVLHVGDRPARETTC